MQTAWASLLLMLGLALGTTSWAAEGETHSDQDALSAAAGNRNSGLDSAFRLLQVRSLPDGVVKECSGTSSAQPGSPVKCDTIAQGNHRVKRHGKVRKFFRKLKKLLPGGGSIIAHAQPNRRIHIA